MSGSRPGVRLSGFGLALLAFALTRLFVAESATSPTGTFVSAALIPLSVGLGLTIFGVALAVGAVSRRYARTVWRWAALGTFAMLLVLVATTLHVVLLGERIDAIWERSGTLVANLLLGGAVLGTIVGDRIARHRTTNEQLVQYAERTMLVNRLLRHEIRNAVAIVEGYASTAEQLADEDSEPDPNDAAGSNSEAASRSNAGENTERDPNERAEPAPCEATEAIGESTRGVERTVKHASEFAATTGEIVAVDLGEAVESVLADVPDDVDVSVVGPIPDDVLVRADDRLELLVAELLENAVKHTGPDASVHLDVVAGSRTVDLVVRDDGPGLPEAAESVLAARSLPEHDDPSFGYGLQMVRLLVEQYGGAIEANCDDGTELAVTLQRTRERSTPALALGVPPVDLCRASVAAVVAALAMGLVANQFVDFVPSIAALYGVESRGVGWVTHVFHSVVFGLLFAAGCTLPRLSDAADSFRGLVGLGVGWGVLLWALAYGLAMPVWLAAVGVNATIPTLTALGFGGHVLWGAVLGGLYALLPGEELLPDRWV